MTWGTNSVPLFVATVLAQSSTVDNPNPDSYLAKSNSAAHWPALLKQTTNKTTNSMSGYAQPAVDI